ncbi:thiolase domain-containing protein [Candidatus Micrarchaeota archaeon]|nr:thiolase domain-containing protein [Candidatus Micrarchaeota archaeon]
MRKVGIIGCGLTRFGEHWGEGFRELAGEAGLAAIGDAGLTGKEIEAIYGGNMSAGRMVGQEHIGALIADQAGLNPIPATRVEAACASGGLAVREAYISVASGLYDCVIAGGIEKMTDISTEQAATTLMGAGDQEWEMFFGATFAALYAMIARRHMHEYGTTEEQLAAVAVKNHEHGSLNEKAHFQNRITMEQALNSPKISDPLKLYDCSPISDGAAALVIASEDFIKRHKKEAVWIAASAQASDTLALHSRKSFTTLAASVEAGRQAFKQAGISVKDVDVAEVHDCFTIAELLALEDLGFAKKGEAGREIAGGRFRLGDSPTINSSGGLKACGHPVGATGVKQVIEVVDQLLCRNGKRQVSGAEVGLTHNVGGSGATCVVHVLRR